MGEQGKFEECNGTGGRIYSREEKNEVRWQEAEDNKEMFNRGLLRRYMAKLLYGWDTRNMIGNIRSKWRKIRNNRGGIHS